VGEAPVRKKRPHRPSHLAKLRRDRLRKVSLVPSAMKKWMAVLLHCWSTAVSVVDVTSTGGACACGRTTTQNKGRAILRVRCVATHGVNSCGPLPGWSALLKICTLVEMRCHTTVFLAVVWGARFRLDPTAVSREPGIVVVSAVRWISVRNATAREIILSIHS